MFFDTSFNSLPTVLANAYQSLKITSVKFYLYVKEMDRNFGAARTTETFLYGNDDTD